MGKPLFLAVLFFFVAAFLPAESLAAEKPAIKRKIEIQAGVKDAEYFAVPTVFNSELKVINRVNITVVVGNKNMKSFDLHARKIKESFTLETTQKGYVELVAHYYFSDGSKVRKSWSLGKCGDSGDAAATLFLASVPATDVNKPTDDVFYGLYLGDEKTTDQKNSDQKPQ